MGTAYQMVSRMVSVLFAKLCSLGVRWVAIFMAHLVLILELIVRLVGLYRYLLCVGAITTSDKTLV